MIQVKPQAYEETKHLSNNVPCLS